MLNGLQRAAFDYFVQHGRRSNGLVADTSRPGSHASIAVIGFALSAYPVGVERGWMTRDEALLRCLAALRFFGDSDQSGKADSTGCHGFYFHFLHMDSGRRAWKCEVSLIDTALLLAGMLTAAAYFTAANADEAELRALVEMLYSRVDWGWAQPDGAAVVHGWKPGSGFLNYGWEGYSEALLLYALGLGSPTHPLTDASFPAWTGTYQWENLYGIDFLYAGPLFIHQFSHAWIDFRGIRDRFMREKHCDYFENSRRATYAQQEYAIRNPKGFAGYGEHCWGITASDGPGPATRRIHGVERRFYDYTARGIPFGLDDGTLAPWAAVAALPFAPEIVLPQMRYVQDTYPHVMSRYGLKCSFNPTFTERSTGAKYWHSQRYFGLDQGPVVLMIENYRTQFLWKVMKRCPYLVTGLRRAGFADGWLSTQEQRRHAERPGVG
ncbi:MAG: hypothetical protein H7322_08090 [Ramlibacter sp.]|nr:hypothetical protein [Ramlibacter sp.]